MNDFKQRGREWQAARKAEQRERDDATKAAREKRYQQNLVLKANGYVWQKVQDIGGPSDDGDNVDEVWTLFDASGNVVSVAQAMHDIAAKQVQ